MSDDPKSVARKELKTAQAQRLLRQFLSTDGPKGNSEEYKRAWCRIYGRRTGEHGGSVLPRLECDDPECDDPDCWCHRP